MSEGCYERFDLDFYKWIWSYKKKHGVMLRERLKNLKNEKDIIILKNYKEMDKYLDKIKRKY